MPNTGKIGRPFHAPTYRACTDRATGISSVPLTIVRPSGNTVSWQSSTVNRSKNEFRTIGPTPVSRSANSSSEIRVPLASAAHTPRRIRQITRTCRSSGKY